ncbi:MAG: acetyl-CoA carboxylase biotin carboxyl carrier protein [Candidatus Melainabacteria bacterium]|nr:MAG: acetyl-CoA carboxylase biotin carboxyl carrier protein [Candidatus Melainabacteria bacterium]
MKIDLDQIRDLLNVVSSTDVSELTIEFGDQRITVKKDLGTKNVSVNANSGSNSVSSNSGGGQNNSGVAKQSQSSAPAATAAPAQAPAPAPAPAPVKVEEPVANYLQITSPMVGTFYRAPSPGSANYVEIGDRVSVGQTVCIIEAMKLMNDMPTEVAGRIVKILVENGTTVEYGQPLFLVDPRG